jgi:hypothetical protein
MKMVDNSTLARINKRINDALTPIQSDVAQAQNDIITLQNNIGGTAGDPIKCIVSRTAAQSISNSSFTNILFDTEVSDNDEMFDVSDPTKVYCKTAGTYYLTVDVTFETNNAGTRFLLIDFTRGGSTSTLGEASENAINSPFATHVNYPYGTINLQVNDYIVVKVYQDSGSALNLTSCRLSLTAWQGVKGDPGTNYLTQSQATDLTDGGDTTLHTHDSRYYTETEINTALSGKSDTTHNHDSAYAPIAKGVTNGDSHDHSGGDGAQIAYASLSGTPTIPDQLSDLADDATHRTVTDTEKSIWNSKAAGDHNHALSNLSEKSYNSLTDKPTIPTALSSLTDDSTHRLVTDTEKSTWNAKQDALVADTDYLTPSTAASTYEPKKGADDNYVTDAEKVKLSNLSGVNTGDQDLSGLLAKTTHVTAINDTELTNNGEFAVFNLTGSDIRTSGRRLTIDGTLGGNSDYYIPSEKAVKTYADGKLAKATNVNSINDTGIADGEIAIFNLTNKDIRTSNVTIVTTIGADDTTVPTSKAVSDAITAAGGYTDEMAQDAVGAIIANTNTVDLTYTDATPQLKADLKKQNTASINLSDDANGLKADLNFSATATDIKMNGTQAVGSAGTAARVDHVHPSDTSRVIAPATNTADKLPQWDGTNSKTLKDGYSLSDLWLYMHPVGSIFISTSSTSPQTTYGGTWVQFGQGKVLVGQSATDTDFDTAEETGGEKTHTLTINESPVHRHGVEMQWNSLSPGSSTEYPEMGNTSSGGRSIVGGDSTGPIQATGGGLAHNNMPPYIVVYMWKRTA